MNSSIGKYIILIGAAVVLVGLVVYFSGTSLAGWDAYRAIFGLWVKTAVDSIFLSSPVL
jgi:uncharacterized membrane protein